MYCENCNETVENVSPAVKSEWVAHELTYLDRETKQKCMEMAVASYDRYKKQGETTSEFAGTADIIRRAAAFYNYIKDSNR